MANRFSSGDYPAPPGPYNPGSDKLEEPSLLRNIDGHVNSTDSETARNSLYFESVEINSDFDSDDYS